MFKLNGAVDMESTQPFEQFKIAIVGSPKTGKSRLAATAPQTIPGKEQYQGIFVADFDGRAASLAGLKGVQVKTYREASYVKKDAWETFQQDLGMIEYAKSKKEEIPATIVLDSETYMSECIMKYVNVSDSSTRRETTVGTFKLYTPKWGSDAYRVEMATTLFTFQRIIELGCHLIVTFHEKPQEAPGSTEAEPKYTGKFDVTPPRANQYLALFNEVWRMNPNGTYKVQVNPDYQFNAGTTLKGLASSEDPSIMQMIQKHLKTAGK